MLPPCWRRSRAERNSPTKAVLVEAGVTGQHVK
jgi:hypothetical protein